MKKIVFILAALFFIFNANNVLASHIPGADITYTCNPANPLTYTFTAKLFIRCPSTNGNTLTGFTISNSCGLANPTIPVFNQVGPAVDVNQLCPGVASTCSGGSQPGIWMYTYQATITFPANCNSWLINFNLCCRDQSSNMQGGTGNSMNVQTQLNTTTAPCNNSPVVTAAPIPFMCAGQTSTYCVTSSDVEGDSIFYELVAPLTAVGTPIAFTPPFSITQPLAGLVMNSVTGCMTFNQPTTGNFVVAVKISSFDANGNLIGFVIHDYQIIVLACSNTPPTPPTIGITNFTGTAVKTGPTTVDVCIGESFCFDVVFSDVNTTDSLIVTQNGTTLLPGATFTQTGSNPVTGTFCWSGTGGFTGSVITFVVNDGACPVMGQTALAVNLNIGNAVFAGPDRTICTGNSLQLNAIRGANHVWTSLSGDPIIVGTNISCDTCQNPLITPTQTTTYLVTSDTAAALCNNVDTVVITVLNATGPSIPDAVICPGPGNFATINVGSGYTNYTWSPACCVGQFANIFNPGTYIVSVDTLVCTMRDTFVVSLSTPPTASISGINTVCIGGTTTLSLPTNFSSYLWSPGNQTTSSITVGVGTYFATITDSSGCVGRSDTVVVTLTPPFPVAITGIDTVCIGGTTTLSLPTNLTSYLWNPGNQTTSSVTVGAGTYFASVINSSGCLGLSDTITVVNSNPQATIQGNNQICIGDVTQLSVTPSFASYLWSNGATSPTTNAPAGAVNVIVTNSFGCSDTASAVIPAFPQPSATIVGADSICLGDIANLSVTPNFVAYLWSNNDINPTTTSTGGNVAVIVQDINGCSDTSSAVIYFFPTPTANFSTNPAGQGQPGVNISFTDLSTSNINSWLWNFGDGGTSTLQNPIYSYANQGVFPVTLTVQSVDGCSDQVVFEYLIESNLIIPNVFTPNGDGINDFLVFENLEFFQNELKVFNRWGREVFSQTNYQNDWDGDDLNAGTYFYVLEIKLATGGTDSKKGTITLFK